MVCREIARCVKGVLYLYSTDIKLTIYDFFEDCSDNTRVINSFVEENIYDAYLADNLFLLKYLTFDEIAEVIQNKYSEELVWLDNDPTPSSLLAVCKHYGVMVDISTICTVFIPLGTKINKADFELQFMRYKFEYKYVLNCNMTAIRTGLPIDIISYDLFDFRPLLTLRRLLMDCITNNGTDIHFVSSYYDKQPVNKIQYRIQRELHDSLFKIDGIAMQKLVNKLISLKSTTSPIDLDSLSGITTDVSNIFDDDTIDLRVTGSRVSAGFYIVIAIQQINTTSKNLDELGLFEQDVKKLRYLSDKNEGLILNTGKMRSGKNTTIFALINEKIKKPIRIMEYSNPVEVRMNFPQVNYKGNTDALKNLMRLAKKEDIDYAILNEIPNKEVAFAVRDLVNSAIGVITTTHLNRVYHLPYKLQELYGADYKNIISQLTAVINHRMFRKQVLETPKLIQLSNPTSKFEEFAKDMGVYQYYEPNPGTTRKLELQPIVEILILSEDLKTELLNHTSLYESETRIHEFVSAHDETIEVKLVRGINMGIFPLQELRQLF